MIAKQFRRANPVRLRVEDLLVSQAPKDVPSQVRQVKLLFLHCFLGVESFARFPQHLVTTLQQASEGAYRFDAALVHARNHGDSPADASHGYLNLAADLDEVLQHEQNDVILIGHSMGARTAMCHNMLARHGLTDDSRVLGMVSLDAAPVPQKHSHTRLLDAALEVRMNEPVTPQLNKRLPLPDVAFLLNNAEFDSTENRRRKIPSRWRFHAKHLRDQQHLVHQWPVPPAETKCEKPILFVKGDNSDRLHPEAVDAVHHHFRNAQIESVPSGHFPHLQCRAETTQHIVSFLQRNVL